MSSWLVTEVMAMDQRLSDSRTIDSKHSETKDNVDMVGDVGDGSKKSDSENLAFF